MLYNNYRIARIWDTEGIDLIEEMSEKVYSTVKVEVTSDGAYFHIGSLGGDKSIKFVPMHAIGGVEYILPEPMPEPSDSTSRFKL